MTRPKILLVHEFYQTHGPSGEDSMFLAERRLLEEGGHEIRSFELHNDAIGGSSWARAQVAIESLWSVPAYRALRRAIREFRPDIVHCHNTFPLISPSAYRAAHDEGVAVVQTLHNYRLICPSGLLQRDQRPCEDCVGHVPWSSVRHGCYRGSRAASAAAAAMLVLNRALGTFRTEVDRYIVLTEFARTLLIRGGLPAERLVVRANGLATDPGVGRGDGGYALFVGRLTAEKGVSTLIEAWSAYHPLPLVVAGDGPLRAGLESQARAAAAPIEFLGQVQRARVLDLMKRATLLVIPSECYEGMPVTFLEATACGCPIAASKLGGLAELMVEGVHGAHFSAGDPQSIIGAITRLLASPERLSAIRHRNRALFEARYAPAEALRSLNAVYHQAMAAHGIEPSFARAQRSRSTSETNTGPEMR